MNYVKIEILSFITVLSFSLVSCGGASKESSEFYSNIKAEVLKEPTCSITDYYYITDNQVASFRYLSKDNIAYIDDNYSIQKLEYGDDFEVTRTVYNRINKTYAARDKNNKTADFFIFKYIILEGLVNKLPYIDLPATYSKTYTSFKSEIGSIDNLNDSSISNVKLEDKTLSLTKKYGANDLSVTSCNFVYSTAHTNEIDITKTLYDKDNKVIGTAIYNYRYDCSTAFNEFLDTFSDFTKA